MPQTPIDTYIESAPEESRDHLLEMRRIIKSVVPDAEEVISYAIPTFKHEGYLVGMAAIKGSVSFYFYNGFTAAEVADDIKDYSSTKSAVHFPLNKPLPEALIKKLVRIRVAENEAKIKNERK